MLGFNITRFQPDQLASSIGTPEKVKEVVRHKSSNPVLVGEFLNLSAKVHFIGRGVLPLMMMEQTSGTKQHAAAV